MRRALLCFAALMAAGPATAQYGDGSDGALSVGSAVSGGYSAEVSGTYAAGVSAMTLVAPSSLLNGEEVILVDMQGADAGNWEYATLSGVSPTTLSFASPTTKNFSDGTRAVKVFQYTAFDVLPGGSISVDGGLFAVKCQTAATVQGAIFADGTGFPGGRVVPGANGDQGDSPSGGGSVNSGANGGGGGGGVSQVGAPAGGGGGGHATAGGIGGDPFSTGTPGAGGGTYGDAQLAQIFWGSGGGGGAANLLGGPSDGGDGGGIVWITAPELTVSGTIAARGTDGMDGLGSVASAYAAGGGGSGGSIYIACGPAGLTNSGNILATGGSGGAAGSGTVTTGDGGDGGAGRIRVDGTIAGAGTFSPAVGHNGPALGPVSSNRGWELYQ